MDKGEEIVIVGAGIAGLATAVGLHRLGLQTLVLESSSSLRTSGYGIMTWTNAWRALDALGVGDYLREHHLQLDELHAVSTVSGLTTSTTSFRGKGSNGNHEVRCLIRKVLLEALAKELPQDTIKYSSKVVHIEESGDLKLVQLADGSIIKAKVLIGCDGVKSVVARWLKLQKPMRTKRSAARGVVEFPDGHGLEPKMFQHYGGGFRHGFVPCDDKSVYWFMTYMSSEQMDAELKDNPKQIKKFVLDNLGNVSERSKSIIEKTELHNVSVAPLKMRWPWDAMLKNINRGNVCVAGDALHPMTPDIGQGGCSSLEDAVILARCLGQALTTDGNTEKEDVHREIPIALEKFSKERRWRSFQLIITAYLVGKIQQSDGKLIRFLREKLLSGLLIRTQLKIADFDCGKLIKP